MINDFFTFEFLQIAFVAVLLMSVTAGLLSPYIVATKKAFLGEAVAHSSLLGLVLATMIVSRSENPYSYFALVLILTIIFSLPLSKAITKYPESTDSLIGIFLAATLGLGVLFHQSFLDGKGDLLATLFGEILLLSWHDVIIQLVIFSFIMIFYLKSYKKLTYMTFDPISAKIAGINVHKYKSIFIFLLITFILASVKVSGIILITPILIIPGLVATKIAKNMSSVLKISIIFALSTQLIGLIISNYFSMATGATMAVTTVFGLIVLLFKQK